MESNFDFLQQDFPVLANFGRLAERYCYSDPNSSLIKLGMMGETIVNLIFTYDKIPLPNDNAANVRINVLLRDGFIDSELASIFHTLRKARNKAAHDNYASQSYASILIEMAHGLCEWFMQTYGDWHYQHRDFIMPSKFAKVTASPETAGQADEEILIKDAEESAQAAPSVSASERKQRSRKAASQRQRPEAETRLLIDEQLRQVGWEADTENLRYSKGTRPEKGRCLAIAEWPTDSQTGHRGFADYALFIDVQMVGIIEAKASHKDIPSVIDYQGKDYPRNIRVEDLKYTMGQWGEYKVPFSFATNGRPYLKQLETKSGIWFLDLRRPDNIPKALHGWISPVGIQEMLAKDVQAGNRNLRLMPYDVLRDKDGLNLREYQIRAVQAAENAIIEGKPTALIAMATGTGKTRTVLAMIYRFLKTKRFRRILFLVDRNALGNQTADVFKEVKLEDLMTLNEIYNVKGLDDKEFEKETRVQIATVQGLVKRILYSDEGRKPAVTDYDLIIVDEAHRGYILDQEMGEDELLYRDQVDYQSKYRAVLDYFDAVKIGLTATPALQTTQIFGEPVFNYTYREAVIEGYLVDHDAPHELITKLRSEGIHYKSGETVTVYDPVTGELKNGEMLEDEMDFDVEQFNRQIIVEDFNRAVLAEIARDIDPEVPEEQGKTLIFAVNDHHADMIVQILKKIYEPTGVDNDAIMKITGKAGGGDQKKIQEMIKRFRYERYPSIVVTVDLLTTGIDVPKITTLVFLRRIKSRILFEQMLGRATRLCPEIKKTHFEIYDPVGVYESLDPVTSMKPVAVNPSATFDQLLDGLEALENEKQQKNQVDQIIAKLQRKKRTMSQRTMEHFVDMSGGMTPDQVIDEIEHQTPAACHEWLMSHRELFQMLDVSRPAGGRPIIVSDREDHLLSHTRGYGKGERPEDYLDAFAEYVQKNRNEIAALNMICTRPKDLTRDSLRKLRLTLDREGFTVQQLNTALSELTNEEIAADIISLIRRYAIGSTLLGHEVRIRRAVDKLKKAHNFTRQELNWIGRMENYLLQESVLNVQVFDEDGRFKEQGGFTKINKVFQNKLESIVLELNEYLYDDGGKTA